LYEFRFEQDPQERIVNYIFPDKTEVMYDYSADNNLKKVSFKEINGSIKEYTNYINLDALNNLLEVQYGNNVKSKFEYYTSSFNFKKY